MLPLLVFVKASADCPRGISGDYIVRRDIPGDDRARCNDGPLSNRDTIQNNRTVAYPAIVLDYGSLPMLSRGCERSSSNSPKYMVASHYRDAIGQHYVISYCNIAIQE